jgi:hypothetical protein
MGQLMRLVIHEQLAVGYSGWIVYLHCSRALSSYRQMGQLMQLVIHEQSAVG